MAEADRIRRSTLANRDEYSIAAAAGSEVVVNNGARRDRLLNIEFIQLDDGLLAIEDFVSASVSVYRSIDGIGNNLFDYHGQY